MLRIRTFVVLTCLFLAVALPAQVPGELAIVNPGFETGDLSGWAVWPGDDPKVTIVSDVVASGENAAKISGGTGAVYKVASSEVNFIPGTFYCIVADVINPAADPLQEGQSVYLASKVATSAGDEWFQSAQVVDFATEIDVWQRLSFGLIYPADATELTVEFKWTGTGADDPGCVIVDDVKIIRMEPMEEVTNLGFEDTEDGLFDWDGGWWTWSYLPVEPPEGSETWLDDAVSRSGDWSLAITTQDWSLWSDDWWWGGYYSWTGYTVRDTVNFYNEGDNFYMSAWVMIPSSDPLEGTANVRLELTFKDNHDQNTSDLGYPGRKYSGTQIEEGWALDEWHFIEAYIQAPEWAAEDTINRIDFNVVLSQYDEAWGTVYVDDIFVARGVSAPETGGNMIAGGNMEDASAWTVYHQDSGDSQSEYEFNFTADLPINGEGGCLNVYSPPTNYTNILFWQELTLQGGKTYELNGAFKDNSPDLQNFWGELYLSLEEPVDGADWKPPAGANTDIYLSMNTWEGCGPGYDGTFQDGYCKGQGKYYTVPGEGDVTVYFGIKTGVWSDGAPLEFDVLFDELSLVEVDETMVEHDPTATTKDYQLYQNYPNPFNAQTTIQYSLAKAGMVKLTVFDVLGKEIATLVKEHQSAGTHYAKFDGSLQPSGIYFYRLEAGNTVFTKKLALIR